MFGRAPLAPTIQGAQKLISEEYEQAGYNDEVEAQHRRWTFYETIKINRVRKEWK